MTNKANDWELEIKEYHRMIKTKRRIIDLAYMGFLEWGGWMNNIIMEDWEKQYGYFPMF